MSAPRDLSVLIVDDLPDAAETLALLLEAYGHRVRTAGSVAAGWNAALASPPDVAVLDLGLPDGSGYDLASELAALPGGPPVVVVLSGYPPEPDRAAAVGIVRHFMKGNSPDELIAFLRTCGSAPAMALSVEAIPSKRADGGT
jgi:CheY-like chemotaxis protein